MLGELAAWLVTEPSFQYQLSRAAGNRKIEPRVALASVLT